ncbi:MAG: YunC family protein [Pseudoramibacter sp.]
MITIKPLKIDGQESNGVFIQSPGGEGHPNMILIQCQKGYLMCGYLNLDAADKFGDAAVLVGGADFDAVLKNPIKGMTSAAKALGVREGMTGEEAAEILNR